MPIGSATDRIILLGGLGGLAATQIAIGLTGTLPALYVLRFLGGLSAAAMMVAATTYVAGRTTGHDRTRGMAFFGTSISLGLVAGPAIAGLLSRPGFNIGNDFFRIDGYSLPFLFSGMLTFGVLAYARTRLTGDASTPRRQPVPVAADSTRRLTLRALLSLVAISWPGSCSLSLRPGSPAPTSA